MTTPPEKRCPTCGTVQNANQFSKCRSTKDGLDSQCLQCRAKYKQANPVLVQTGKMLTNARARAIKKGLIFDIDHNYIRSIIPSHCPILGMPLEWSSQRGNGRVALPNSPSLDRIDPSKGYVKGNVWIISSKANRIKSDASHEELKLVTEAVGRAIVNSLEW